jgi:hypothetical protein
MKIFKEVHKNVFSKELLNDHTPESLKNILSLPRMEYDQSLLDYRQRISIPEPPVIRPPSFTGESFAYPL